MLKTDGQHARTHLHEPRTLGERAADAVAAGIGSWKFVIIQNTFVLAWIVFNIIALYGLHMDPYPFILLNLLFSWQASNTGPILQLSGNRAAAKDRARDDLEASEVEMLTQSMSTLHRINRQQLVLLVLWPLLAIALLFWRRKR